MDNKEVCSTIPKKVLDMKQFVELLLALLAANSNVYEWRTNARICTAQINRNYEKALDKIIFELLKEESNVWLKGISTIGEFEVIHFAKPTFIEEMQDFASSLSKVFEFNLASDSIELGLDDKIISLIISKYSAKEIEDMNYIIDRMKAYSYKTKEEIEQEVREYIPCRSRILQKQH